MEFDYSKLIGRIIEKYGSRKAFASAYGVSENCLSQKLNGKSRISINDIAKMKSSDFLSIADNEIGDYFFTPKVR